VRNVSVIDALGELDRGECDKEIDGGGGGG
jgi:hypothetical protein